MIYLGVIVAALTLSGVIADPLNRTMEIIDSSSKIPEVIGSTNKTVKVIDAATETLEGSVGASVCGGDFTSETGIIETPNYPEEYGNNQECVWNIQVPAGRKIVLSSTNFNLEDQADCNYDSLTIINLVDGTQIDKLCGLKSSLILQTNTHSLRLVFTSDGSVVRTGFSIRWKSSQCGGDLNQETGTLQSPNHPDNYDNDLMCVWNIKVPAGQVAIRATRFDVEESASCVYDSLEIHDAVENNRLGKFCGDDIFAVLAPSNKLMIVFKTDHSVTKSGFSLTWNTITECVGNYIQDSGILLSPNHPENYGNNERCTWDIALNTDGKMLIDVPVFDVEDHATCDYDVLEVYDLPSNVKLGSYCGSEPFSLLANGKAVRVKFNTDSSITKTGFTLKFKKLQNECGGSFTQEKGKITSPNYPGNYDNNLNCAWILSLPKGGSIHLAVTDMDLEHQMICSYDSIEISDAATGMSLGEGKYCGSEAFELATRVSSVKVVLKTDRSITGRGFQLNWRKSMN